MLTISIAGLGSRGKDTYGQALTQMRDRARVVAVADPNPAKVREVAGMFDLKPEQCFGSVEEMLEKPRLADVMLICTQDRQHVPNAIPALEKGYDVLLEKPISPELEQCKKILKVSRETGRKVAVCHVLRYAPFYRKIKEVLDSGVLGELTSIMGIENVCYWHQAHSFVRGNWRRSDETSPMFLAKCCHDMDLMVWLTGRKCARLSSFGSLSHFKPENAPEGAAQRCLEGCRAKERCPYDAEKIYITNEATGVAHGHTGWPCDILALHPTEETIRRAIETGPYGRCVYFCDNNVVDHQVVNLEFEGGITASVTMCAFTNLCERTITIQGTRGELQGRMEEDRIQVVDFVTGNKSVYELNTPKTGHSGSDAAMMKELVSLISTQRQSESVSKAIEAIDSHLIAFAAEESRIQQGRVIEL